MNSIEITSGKIYVEGKETTDPTLIGLALLDIIEQSKETTLKVA